MRTTLDLPDSLYRKTKAVAALRGSSMKDLIGCAIEKEVNGGAQPKAKIERSKFPVIQRPNAPKVDFTNFDFDNLLG
jgi:hypothetical protein